MSVITISRGSFSGGKLLAECLAQKLGYRCIDRDVIVERAAVSGISQERLREALEKPPGFLDRFKHNKYVYLTLIQAALTEEVRTGQAVYHGLAGHLLLRGGPQILRTRIIAPLEFRIRMAQERLKLSREEAAAHIEQADDDRRRWTHFLYGVDWGAPELYDLVINLEQMSIDTACAVVCTAIERRCFVFTPECQQQMDDLALASRVRATLALNPGTSHLELEVAARKGAITIKGKLPGEREAEELERVAASVAGVKSINMDELTPAPRA